MGGAASLSNTTTDKATLESMLASSTTQSNLQIAEKVNSVFDIDVNNNNDSTNVVTSTNKYKHK